MTHLYLITLLLFILLPLGKTSFFVNAGKHATNKKVQRKELDEIKRLINAKVQREMAQSDFTPLSVKLLPTRQGVKVTRDELSVNNPDDYMQGDIDLAEWQAKNIHFQLVQDLEIGSGSPLNQRRRRKVGRDPLYKRWNKEQPIGYDFTESISEPTKEHIREALNIWQRNTCLRFVEGGAGVDRLEFFDGGGCSSFVGKIGGTQGISITAPGCDFVGIIAHELAHALGAFHEQARPDQPRNIIVHYNNIPLHRWNNFYPIGEDQATTFDLPYDTGSVMHYGAYGFAADEFRPSISTVNKYYQSTIGQRVSPSFLDIQAINIAYRCHENCINFPGIAPQCEHGGYQNPNNCSECLCPRGFGGSLCGDVEFTKGDCGGLIKVSSSPILLTSPNSSTRGSDCIWLLKAPKGAQIFGEFADRFSYPCEDICDRSFVELKTGADFRVTGYRFCCGKPPGVFKSTREEMVLIHQLRDSGRNFGFQAKFWSNADHHPTGEEHSSTSTIKTTTASSTFESKTTTSTEVPSSSHTTPPLLVEKLETTTSFGELSVWSRKAPSFTSATLPPPDIVTPSLRVFPVPATTTESFLPKTFPQPEENCICGAWTEWTDCSQMCGACGKRMRQRKCHQNTNPRSATASLPCQAEEKRACNFESCPEGTNFLINNGEFHILWKGCCIGSFRQEDGNSCGPIDASENPFLRILSSLLSSRDSSKQRGNNGRNGTDIEIAFFNSSEALDEEAVVEMLLRSSNSTVPLDVEGRIRLSNLTLHELVKASNLTGNGIN